MLVDPRTADSETAIHRHRKRHLTVLDMDGRTCGNTLLLCRAALRKRRRTKMGLPMFSSLLLITSNLVLFAMLSALARIDAREQRLPDILTLPLLGFGLIAGFLNGMSLWSAS